MVVLTEKFRFIRDDIFLCPWVDTETGKQKLIMQKINLKTNEIEFEDSIDCIHTAIIDISLNQFNEYQNNNETQENLLKKTLFIRSSDDFKEINLVPEEKFKALKSWTAGISEAGKDALSIQSNIDSAVGIWVQISSRLLSFMAKIDPNYIYEILRKVEKECKFEGVNHKSSIIANLLPILWSISDPEDMEWEREYKEYKEMKPADRKILSAIIAINPPHELFEKNPSFIYLLKDFPDYFNKLNIEPLEDFFHSDARYFEILVELRPNLIINRLKSEARSESINIKKYLDLIFESFSMKGSGDFSTGQKQILLYILESKLDIIDSMDSYRYYFLSEIHPSLPKNLLDEAKKKCTKNDILNQDCFFKIMENMMDWISSKYEYDFDKFDELYVNKHDIQIIYSYLVHRFHDSSLMKFSPLIEFVLKYQLTLDCEKKNIDLIVLLLVSESLDLFNKIPKHILIKAADFELAKLYFTKVNEMYNHNEEMLVKKCTQFLNLLIIDLKIKEDRKFFNESDSDVISYKYKHDNVQNVYYYDNYREIINFLLKFQPPPKLFKQNRLFLKFLIFPEALKIQKYRDFIKSLEPLPIFMELDEIENLECELKEYDQLGDISKKANVFASLGDAYWHREEFKAARNYYYNALEIEENSTKKFELLNMIGNAYISDNKYNEALETYNELLKIADSLDALSLKASMLNTVGDRYCWMKEYKKAVEIYSKALKIEDQLGNLSSKAKLLNLIGSAYSMNGENNIALESYKEAFKIENKLDNISGKITLLNNIGMVYSKIGDNDLAIEKFKEGIKLAYKLGDLSEKERVLKMLKYHISLRNNK